MSEIRKTERPENTSKGNKTQCHQKMHKNKIHSIEIQWWRDRIEGSIAKSRKVRGGNYVQLATIGYRATAISNGNPQSRLEKIPVPENRCLVFRGFCIDFSESFLDDTKRDYPLEKPKTKQMMLKMITDKRSAKAQQILENLKNDRHNNPAELVWWFSQSSEQYRIAGDLFLIGCTAEDTTVIATSKDNLHDQKSISEDKTDVLKAYLEERKKQWGNLSDNAREQFYWHWPGKEYDGAPEDIPAGGRENLQKSLTGLNLEDDEGKVDKNPTCDSTITKMDKVLEPPENFMLLLLQPNCCKYLRLSDNFAQRDELLLKSSNALVGDKESWKCYRTNP